MAAHRIVVLSLCRAGSSTPPTGRATVVLGLLRSGRPASRWAAWPGACACVHFLCMHAAANTGVAEALCGWYAQAGLAATCLGFGACLMLRGATPCTGFGACLMLRGATPCTGFGALFHAEGSNTLYWVWCFALG
eukprot:1158032-Pelagomonas_calceolata.AAC.13